MRPWETSRFEVRCPHDDQLLAAWGTAPDGAVLMDAAAADPSFEVQLIGFEFDARNAGPALPGEEPHERYVAACTVCVDQGRRPYGFTLTTETVEAVVHPILQSLHGTTGGTWRENDIHALVRRVSQGRRSS